LRIYGWRIDELLKILLLSIDIFTSKKRGDLRRKRRRRRRRREEEEKRQLQILSRCCVERGKRRSLQPGAQPPPRG